jgi:hypothetical protein
MTNASGKRPAYPIDWPAGWPRTPVFGREAPRFRPSFAEDRDAVIHRLNKRGSNVVITSNLPTRKDGIPYSDRRVEDPGIAVWWVERGAEKVLACDRWNNIVHNMHAVRLTIDALAGINRWGAAEIVARAFSGFTALPPGTPAPPPVVTVDWQAEFDVDLGKLAELGLANLEVLAMVEKRFRARMMEQHPDKGGSTAIAADLNAAMAAAREQLGG